MANGEENVLVRVNGTRRSKQIYETPTTYLMNLAQIKIYLHREIYLHRAEKEERKYI